MTTTTGRPPLWRDVRVLAWAFQLLVVGLVVVLVWWLARNYEANTSRQNLSTNWDYLRQPAGFPIANSDFRQSQAMRDALVEGLKNTLRLAITGIVLATIVGILIGVARLSKNFVVRSAAKAYVEFIRNVPLLVLLFLVYSGVVLNAFPRPNEAWVLGPFAIISVRGANSIWYEGDNWRFLVALGAGALAAFVAGWWRTGVAARTGRHGYAGGYAVVVGVVVLVAAWVLLGLGVTTPERGTGPQVTGGIAMTPAYFASLVALVVYTSSHIAEIVRGSIQAVPTGQGEAADALALSPFQRMRYVVLPQALRIGLPPIGNQHINLAKNTSLAAVIAFPELTKVTLLSTASRAPAIPALILLLVLYLAFSLFLSALINIANRRLAIAER